MAATLIKMASIPQSIISCNNSDWSRRHKYANEINPNRLHLGYNKNL